MGDGEPGQYADKSFAVVMALAVTTWAAVETAGWLWVVSSALGWALLALALADLRSGRLPDMLTLPLIPAGLLACARIEPLHLPDHVAGAMLGFIALAGLRVAYRRLRGRDGLGLGDAKLMAALGAWVSWRGLPSVLLFASLFALAVVLMVALRRGRCPPATAAIPFGPYLAAGGWLVWLYGPISS